MFAVHHRLPLVALIAATACTPARRSAPASPGPRAPADPAVVPALPALFGALEPGRHPVGFRQLVTVDPARAHASPYDRDGAADRRRPIVINVWYPAAAVTGGSRR